MLIAWVAMKRQPQTLPKDTLIEFSIYSAEWKSIMRSHPEVKSIVIGVFAKAQELYAMKIHALSVVSNQIHGLLTTDSAEQLAAIVRFVLDHLAKQIELVVDGLESVCRLRCDFCVVSAEEKDQVARLRHILKLEMEENSQTRAY